MKHPLITVASFQMDYESSQWLSQLGTIQKQMHAGLREGIDFGFNKDDGSVKMVEKKTRTTTRCPSLISATNHFRVYTVP